MPIRQRRGRRPIGGAELSVDAPARGRIRTARSTFAPTPPVSLLGPHPSRRLPHPSRCSDGGRLLGVCARFTRHGERLIGSHCFPELCATSAGSTLLLPPAPDPAPAAAHGCGSPGRRHPGRSAHHRRGMGQRPDPDPGTSGLGERGPAGPGSLDAAESGLGPGPWVGNGHRHDARDRARRRPHAGEPFLRQFLRHARPGTGADTPRRWVRPGRERASHGHQSLSQRPAAASLSDADRVPARREAEPGVGAVPHPVRERPAERLRGLRQRSGGDGLLDRPRPALHL
jgi:hypothetical protein